MCLMPFALNESTRFISPTKTVEYMAAEKPIVSTPITDVVEPYGDIVYIGNTPEEFLAACDTALSEQGEAQARRIAAMREALAKTSWDRTAEAIVTQIERVLESKRTLGEERVTTLTR